MSDNFSVIVENQFLQQSKDRVGSITWVKNVIVTLSAQAAKPLVPDSVSKGLQQVSNIIAVSSCKVHGCFVLLASKYLYLSSF